jgi:zinc transport system substrate-binding protein
MQGVGEPGLIVDSASSPHTYAMKPSQAQMLEKADIVFWVGHEMETFLASPLETVGANAQSVELIDAPDLIGLTSRKGGAFEKHDDKHDGDEAAHKKHEAGHDEQTPATRTQHEHGSYDSHVWLDPQNAKAMVNEMAQVLASADPGNSAKYKANADALMVRLDALIAEVSAELKPVKDKGFIVFHDAYQYFENRFGVTASGSITVSPEVLPGAARISEIRARIKELGATCVFAEPQFEPKLISTVTEGTLARSGVIDPLGASIPAGADLYFQVIRNMASSIRTCLAGEG